MPGQSGKAKGKTKPRGPGKSKGRGRKSTDWLDTTLDISDLIENQTSEAASASTSNRRQDLSVTGGIGNQTFTLRLGTETTGAIRRDANAKDVEKAIRKLSNVKGVVATGGPLLTAPVEIDFKNTTLASVPLLIRDPTNDITVTVGASAEIGWTWDDPANWKDANSARDIMKIESMQLTADPTGLWRLAFARTLYGFDHRWVYKLNAYSTNDEVLLRLTIPATGGVNVLLPGVTQPIVVEGMSLALADLLPEISRWVRFGVGEYWD